MSFQSFDWISLVLIPALSLAPAPSEWNAITRNDAWIQSCKHLPMKIFSNLNIWNSELSTANSMQTGNANLIHSTVIWQTCSLYAAKNQQGEEVKTFNQMQMVCKFLIEILAEDNTCAYLHYMSTHPTSDQSLNTICSDAVAWLHSFSKSRRLLQTHLPNERHLDAWKLTCSWDIQYILSLIYCNYSTYIM